MKKLLFVFLLKVLFAHVIYGKQVDPETARAVGARFLQTAPGRIVSPDKISLALIYTARNTSTEKLSDQRPYYYVFNLRNSTGFLIIAADDNVYPILAYSNEKLFDPAALPAHVAAWLKGYEDEIAHAATQTAKPAPAVTEAWRQLKNEIPRNSNTPSGTSVNPLLATRWNQSPFYNAYCPGQSVTGCVATSMAQLMKYWNHPLTGSGAHHYTHQRYGRLSANFELRSYEWKSMPDTISNINREIASLMYDCGVSVEMDYGPYTSNAYLIDAANPASAEHALKKYFDYSKNAKGIKLEDYNYATWLSIIRSELDAKRPVLYAGFGNSGGHCFITDGYDENNYFHFNWGWGGAYDGYFLLSALNPSGVGIGGGSGNYNRGHQALIGIEPERKGPQSESSEIRFREAPAFKDTLINYGEAISISAKVFNQGVSDFNGDLLAAVFDVNNLFFDYLEIKPGNQLQPGTASAQQLDFKNSGLPGMLPGKYYVGFFYRASGSKWKPLAASDNSFPLLKLVVGKSNRIELNSELITNAERKLMQRGPVAVHLDLVNKGSNVFKGEYQLALYDLDGKVAEVIGIVNEQKGLMPGGTYTNAQLLFEHSGISVEAGSYLLAISFREIGTQDWKFAGGGSFGNPVMVFVEPAALTADRYEYNNAAAKASALPVVYSYNKAVLKTDSASSHQRGDEDYYKIELPAGFDYMLQAKLNDAAFNSNGNSYTLDAVFTISEDTVNWSAPYDDRMDTLELNGGKTIYFHVSPYFPGQTGSYMLEIEITRKTALAGGAAHVKTIKVYPNPVKTRLLVDLQQYKGNLMSVELHTLNGRSVYKHKAVSLSTQLSIPVDSLQPGIYILTLQTEEGRSSHKIMVTR